MTDIPPDTGDASISWRLADIRMRDPYIVEFTPGRFALFGTTDENVWSGPATGFDCYVSNDLESWEGPVPAFRPARDFWADTQFWAPEVVSRDDRFFLFATFATSTHVRPRGVAVLVSDSVTGPYSPWSDGPLTPPDSACIDGTLFVDDEGSSWLVYSRGPEGGPEGPSDGEMRASRLSDDWKRCVGESVLLFRASSAPWSRPLTFPDAMEPPVGLNLAIAPRFTDGPSLIRLSDGPLMMLWSSHSDNGYAIGVARSADGSVTGPWTQEATPLWKHNGGHAMLLRTSTGPDYLVFHWPNDAPAERTQVIPVKIEASGMTLVPTTPATQRQDQVPFTGM